MQLILSALLFVAGTIGLFADSPKPESGSLSTKQPSVKELIAAPEKITVGTQSLQISAYLWRDFMPISPADGKALMAAITFQTTDKSEFPKDVKVVNVWVVNGEKVWSPSKVGVRQWDDKSSVEIVAGGGPKWGPGISVEVIIEVMDSQKRTHLLRASKQPIHRTD